MASNIDTTKPEAGSATTASVRANFTAAKTEIESLQDFNVIHGDNTVPGYTLVGPGLWLASPVEALLLTSAYVADGAFKTVALRNLSKFSGEYPPDDAKVLLMNLDIAIGARGAAGFHEMNLYINHVDNVNQQGHNEAFAAWEPAGLAAGTWFTGEQRIFEMPVIDDNLTVQFALSDLPTNHAGTKIQGVRIVGFRR